MSISVAATAAPPLNPGACEGASPRADWLLRPAGECPEQSIVSVVDVLAQEDIAVAPERGEVDQVDGQTAPEVDLTRRPAVSADATRSRALRQLAEARPTMKR